MSKRSVTVFYVRPDNSDGVPWGLPLRLEVDEVTGIVTCPQLVGPSPSWPHLEPRIVGSPHADED